ncbi:MAG: hypothetical protein WBV60_19865 [Terriglobales bacterium]
MISESVIKSLDATQAAQAKYFNFLERLDEIENDEMCDMADYVIEHKDELTVAQRGQVYCRLRALESKFQKMLRKMEAVQKDRAAMAAAGK